ncbi:MAG: hypothetical protein M1813_008841 [Trichoglossum hirsutum]|nr:MAG: hypothetical protein M1813_008841 [Trichoglossum hirsutum]
MNAYEQNYPPAQYYSAFHRRQIYHSPLKIVARYDLIRTLHRGSGLGHGQTEPIRPFVKSSTR